MKKLLTTTCLLGSTMLLAACTSSDNDTSENTAPVRLQLTDGPIDELAAVNLAVTRVIFKADDDANETDEDSDDNGDSDDDGNSEDVASDGGNDISFDITPTRVINLLDLQGAKSVTLTEDFQLPVGDYEEIRLVIDPDLTNVVVDGTSGEIPLRIPSGAQSGLKIKGDIDVLASGASYTLDFDLRQSIKGDTQSGYRLRPVIRLVDNSGVGALAGSITITNQDPVCSGDLSKAAMYLFEGENVTPDGYGSATEPFANALITETNQYEFGFIPVGVYTLAIACDAADDVVEDDTQTPSNTDDSLTFSDAFKVKIRSGKVSIQNFPDDDEDDDDSDEGRDDAEELDNDGNRDNDDD